MFLIAGINSCHYDQAEEFAIVTGIVEDGTESKTIVVQEAVSYTHLTLPTILLV